MDEAAPVAMYAGADGGAKTDVKEPTCRVKKMPQSYGTCAASACDRDVNSY